ncbi:MAG: divalent-cation tolerance protein CutA [Rhodospirillales bacterium]|nr:divalent-cation tolerance protein CutA [Rhodospirillales bacterium]
MIYVTAASQDEALSIGATLVEERLVACANVLGDITSVYRWDGEVQEETEVALVLKTRSDLVDRVTQRVMELHDYTCPCVVALPIVGGNPDYIAWIAAETDQPEED